MRVKFKLYNMDFETYNPQASYYGVPSFESYDATGTVKGYVREEGITYAVVLSDERKFHSINIEDLEEIW